MKILFFFLSIFFLTKFYSQVLLDDVNKDKVQYLASNSAYRNWWDVQHYTLDIQPEITNQTLKGKVSIDFKINSNWNKISDNYMQIDLQAPLLIDSMFLKGRKINHFTKPTNSVYLISFSEFLPQLIGERNGKDTLLSLVIYYSGKPIAAKNPPWDGGMIWSKDSMKRDWIAVACQGIGGSVWFPCKDIEYDEPDRGVDVFIHTIKKMKAVSNGRLVEVIANELKDVYHWRVTYPINIYDITMDIGYYVSFEEKLKLKNDEELDCQYFVLDYEFEKAIKQFNQVKKILTSLEEWFGNYPFYNDGYKVVQTPFLGMEHQSAIAYGNDFKNGYKGTDLSKTGWGLKFDFILVHETGHEWFGNAISSFDIADMWIHEAFTTYSEALYLESYYGKKAAQAYVKGIQCRIKNDVPIIGVYNHRQEGSGDMYFKGANMIQMYRELLDDDAQFKKMLVGMGQFWYKNSTSKEIESYMNEFRNPILKADFSKMFDQYLRTKQVPILEYKKLKGKTLVKWSNCVEGFDMPVKLKNGNFIQPTTEWLTIKKGLLNLRIDPNFYIEIKEVKI